MTTFDETKVRRGQPDNAGQFREHTHTAPEQGLTGPGVESISPKVMAMLGSAQPSVNTFADHVDAKHAENRTRPLRPYLPLDAGDDDEFFDAPVGSVLTADIDGTTERYRFANHPYDWERLSERGVPGERLPAGEVWGRLFSETGHMHSAKLDLPPGHLYSDRTHYVTRGSTDERILADTVRMVLNGKSGHMVSQTSYGDSTFSGVPEAARGALTFKVVDGHFSAIAANGVVVREYSLDGTSITWRDGTIVIRSEPHDPGYGWEEAYERA